MRSERGVAIGQGCLLDKGGGVQEGCPAVCTFTLELEYSTDVTAQPGFATTTPPARCATTETSTRVTYVRPPPPRSTRQAPAQRPHPKYLNPYWVADEQIPAPQPPPDYFAAIQLPIAHLHQMRRSRTTATSFSRGISTEKPQVKRRIDRESFYVTIHRSHTPLPAEPRPPHPNHIPRR